MLLCGTQHNVYLKVFLASLAILASLASLAILASLASLDLLHLSLSVRTRAAVCISESVPCQPSLALMIHYVVCFLCVMCALHHLWWPLQFPRGAQGVPHQESGGSGG